MLSSIRTPRDSEVQIFLNHKRGTEFQISHSKILYLVFDAKNENSFILCINVGNVEVVCDVFTIDVRQR